MKANLLPVILFLLFFDSAQLLAQPALQWVASYNDGPLDTSLYSADMAVNDSGYAYITGYSTGNLTGWDIATIKYDPNGNQIWAQRYNSIDSSMDRSFSLCLDDSENVYVAGSIAPLGGLVTIKYNKNGILQWVRAINSSSSWNYGYDIITDDTGNVYVTGVTQMWYFSTMKYDRDGNLQWLSIDSTAAGQMKSYIALDSLLNVYVLARGQGSGFACNLIKYSNSGVKQWMDVYEGDSLLGAEPRDLKIDNNNNVIMLGETIKSSGTDYIIRSYDSNGNLNWSTSFHGDSAYLSSDDIPYAMVIDSLNNIYITGEIHRGTSTYNKFCTIKLNPAGTVIWKSFYTSGFPNWNIGYDIAIDKFGYLYVTGESGGGNNTFVDCAIIKYDPNGNQMWVEHYQSPVFELSYVISVQPNLDIYLLGLDFSASSTSMLTLKYEQGPAGVQPASIPSWWEVYPNPAANSIRIAGQEAEKMVTIEIWNMLGEMICTDLFPMGPANKEIDISEFAEGIYVVRMISGDSYAEKKLVIHR